MSVDNFQYRPLNQNNNKKNPKEKIQELINAVKTRLNKKNGSSHNFRGPDQKPDIARILKLIALAIVALTAAGVITMTLLIIIVSFSLPSIHDLDKLSLAQSTTIFDREGNVLYVKHGDENRQYVPYEQITNNIINATIAIEDDQFWSHSGFDLIGITRALVTNVSNMDSKGQGGSTITQQYIKNTFLTSEKSYIRKLKELILAVQLEQTYDKKKILELYLNKIPYGNNAFGVEKASQIYFKKNAKDLDLAEASVLASLPKAPSHYNPYGQYKYSILTKTFEPEELKTRAIRSEADLKDSEFTRGLIGKEYKLGEQNSVYVQGRTDIVLKTMQKLGYINEEQKITALEKLQSLEFNKYIESIKAPHFVFYVLNELENKYGKELVEQGGLQVYTTIDPKLQEIADKAIDEGVDKNAPKYNAKNGALTAIDPKTGQILAMVGSRDFKSVEINGAVNVATQYRQPGSSFKPIVYAKAFYNRYAPGSIVFDVETRFGASAFPKNYDGTFSGPITIRKALGQSRNIPAIKAYFLAGEQEGVIEMAQKMGIKFVDTEKDYGWPLALGTAEVRQLDIVSAFGVFANAGVRHEPLAILKIKNSRGETLEEFKEKEGEEVLDPQIAYLISNILSDPSVSLGEYLRIPGRTTAVKTGTSNRRVNEILYPNDLWTIGYTPNLVVGVWTGNNTTKEGNLGMTASGYTASAPIWKQFMTEALKEAGDQKFQIPEGIRHETISRLTGKLPAPNTPESQLVTEVFASFSIPTEIDDSYTEAKIDDRNKKLANDYCPQQFIKNQVYLNIHDIAPIPSWEEGAQRWMQAHMGETIEGSILGAPPITLSELCTEDNLKSAPKVSIISPADNDKIESGSNLDVTLTINSQNGTEKAEFYLDGQLKYTQSISPYTGLIRLPKAEIGTQKHTIKVVVYDKYGYTGDKSVTFYTAKNVTIEPPDTSDSTDTSLSPSAPDLTVDELPPPTEKPKKKEAETELSPT
jgi:penicillin-binding protein 1A